MATWQHGQAGMNLKRGHFNNIYPLVMSKNIVNIGKMVGISCGKSMKIIYKSWNSLWLFNKIAIEAMARSK
jgi:hypothetical protein